MAGVKVDLSPVAGLGRRIEAAGRAIPGEAARALNKQAAKARTQMRRETAKQTGLPYGTMVRAIKLKSASDGDLTAIIRSRGGDISLRVYKARETPAGVVARPPRGPAFLAQGFIKGGRFPNRVRLKLGGHVFVRVGKGRLPIRLQKTGIFIPDEMISGGSLAAFNKAAAGMGRALSTELFASL